MLTFVGAPTKQCVIESPIGFQSTIPSATEEAGKDLFLCFVGRTLHELSPCAIERTTIVNELMSIRGGVGSDARGVVCVCVCGGPPSGGSGHLVVIASIAFVQPFVLW